VGGVEWTGDFPSPPPPPPGGFNLIFK